jgi:hypothetical protein
VPEINKCLEPHPERLEVLCDNDPHPWGYHTSKDYDLTWAGLPYPTAKKSSRAKKADTINKIPAETRTGPPTGVDVIDRPYIQQGQPSSGYAEGSETSKAAEPLRSEAQIAVLAFLIQQGAYGATWRETQDHLLNLDPDHWGHVHHGSVSGALSVMHKTGRITRLAESRGGCEVYVTLDHINGRETRKRGTHRLTNCPHCGGDLAVQ